MFLKKLIKAQEFLSGMLKARFECSDRRMRIDLATHDTCPAERVNAAMNDAVVDGGLLKCD